MKCFFLLRTVIDLKILSHSLDQWDEKQKQIVDLAFTFSPARLKQLKWGRGGWKILGITCFSGRGDRCEKHYREGGSDKFIVQQPKSSEPPTPQGINKDMSLSFFFYIRFSFPLELLCFDWLLSLFWFGFSDTRSKCAMTLKYKLYVHFVGLNVWNFI